MCERRAIGASLFPHIYTRSATMTVISSLVPIVLSLCDVIARVKMMIIAMRRNKEQSRHTHMCMLWSREPHFLIRAFSPNRDVVKNYNAKNLIHRRRAIFLLCAAIWCVCTENNAVLCMIFSSPAWCTMRIFATLHALSNNKVNFWWKYRSRIKGWVLLGSVDVKWARGGTWVMMKGKLQMQWK